MKNKCDVLCLDMRSSGRDVHITEPVLVYLEEKYKLKIERENLLEGIKFILKNRPKILLLHNDTGAPELFNISKFASKLGIKVVTLISEGDYIEQRTEILFWGWNKDKKIYCDLKLLWSNRVKEYIKKYVKNIETSKLQVSGATGFDRYKMLNFKTKQDLQKELNIKNKKVILVTGWGFDKFFNKKFYDGKILGVPRELIDNKDFFIKSRIELNKILKKVIELNKEITFILKIHPMSTNIKKTEFEGLEKYENTIFLKDEIEIGDLLNGVDLIFSFESTTCLEGWLLNKTTLLINPCGENFTRSIVSGGSVKCKVYEEVQGYIDEYYLTNKIKDFLLLAEKRKRIIKQVIENDDGKNYIRAAEKIIELYNDKKNKQIYINKFVIGEILRYIYYKLKVKIRKIKPIWNYSKLEREYYTEKYREAIKNDKSNF